VANLDDLRRRAGRLLAGERHTRDLDALFLELRQRSYGNKAVADVGNFAGHAQERDKGIAWKGVKSITAVLDYQVPRMRAQAKGIDFPNDRASLIAGALGALDRVPPATVKAELNVGKRRAKSALKSALGKIAFHDGRIIRPSNHLTPLEDSVLWKYTSTITHSVVFNDADLISQLGSVLRQNGLITEKDRPRLEAQRQFVGLYALEKMHLCKLVLGKNRTAQLLATVDDKDRLYVISMVGIEIGDGPAFFGMPVYSTSCLATDWCEEETLRALDDAAPCWLTPLEISPLGKLQML
jgi:hypothetical protein